MSDNLGRILRTLVQLLAGGAFTALFEQIVTDVPPQYSPYLVIIFSLLTAIAMNVGREQGWLKPAPEPEPAAPETYD